MKSYRVLQLSMWVAGVVVIVFVSSAVAEAASFGINFQTDRDGYGPHSISAETPAEAFGVPATNWYETGVLPFGSTMFATGAGSVSIQWDSYPLVAPGIAYGWTHANQVGVTSPPGDPLTGEDAVFSAFLFGLQENIDGVEHPITVTISNLGSVANLAAGYSVRLLASSEWPVETFTPATVADNASNSEVVSFSQDGFDHPLWWTGPPWASAGALGESTVNVFTGDTLTITLAGPNAFGPTGPFDGSDPNAMFTQRTSLAGVIIDFAQIPEPNSIILMMCSATVVGLMGRRRCIDRAFKGP
jgi:hypothetical protein